MNTERAAVLADTLNEFRQDRHKIRAVEIISECCPTCDLDSNREFSLEAVPLLPHSYCTNPNGCQCYYAPVPVEATPVSEEVPQLNPPQPVQPVQSVPQPVPQPVPVFFKHEPEPGVPAYLKTPTAAAIALGAVVIAFAIGLISYSASRPGSLSGTVVRPEIYVPPAQVSRSNPNPNPFPSYTTDVAPASISVPVPQTNWRRDRELEAKAERDLRAAEANARANENALYAREVAIQQQTYLQNLLSRQPQGLHNVGATTSRVSGIQSSEAVTATPDPPTD